MFKNIKKKIENHIIGKSFKIMRRNHSKSPAVKYAETEMEVGINGVRKYDIPNIEFMERFPDLIAAISEFCEKYTDRWSDADTGIIKISEMIQKCVLNKPVFPLTFDDTEFAYMPGAESDIKRNLRLSSVEMRPDGRFIYSDAVNLIYSFDIKPADPNKKRSRLKFCRNRCTYGPRSGSYLDVKTDDGIYAVAGDGQIYRFTKNDVRILNRAEFDPNIKFDIDAYVVTCSDLHMLVFIRLEDLSVASEIYDILIKSCQESVDMLNMELTEHSVSDVILKETERHVEWTIKNLAKVQPKPEMK